MNIDFDKLELFLDDLKPVVREQVIDFLGGTGNYDTFPLFVLFPPDDYVEGGEPDTEE